MNIEHIGKIVYKNILMKRIKGKYNKKQCQALQFLLVPKYPL